MQIKMVCKEEEIKVHIHTRILMGIQHTHIILTEIMEENMEDKVKGKNTKNIKDILMKHFKEKIKIIRNIFSRGNTQINKNLLLRTYYFNYYLILWFYRCL